MLVAFRRGLPTSAALAVLQMISAQPGRAAEVTVLLIANLAVADTVIRFASYRRRVFRRKPPRFSRLAFPAGCGQFLALPFSARLAMPVSRAAAVLPVTGRPAPAHDSR